jgi:hypothetical protein
MLDFIKLSSYTKMGILLVLMGLLVLGLEDNFLDESTLFTVFYLLPIGCFFFSFVAFIFAAKNSSNS